MPAIIGYVGFSVLAGIWIQEYGMGWWFQVQHEELPIRVRA